MRLIISKIFRNYTKSNIPTCYAFQHIPESLDDICDCGIFCKYPPKGNAKIGHFDKLLLNNEPVPNIALQYLPKSLDDTCNCDTFCINPPKDNVKTPLNLKTNLPLTYFTKKN